MDKRNHCSVVSGNSGHYGSVRRNSRLRFLCRPLPFPVRITVTNFLTKFLFFSSILGFPNGRWNSLWYPNRKVLQGYHAHPSQPFSKFHTIFVHYVGFFISYSRAHSCMNPLLTEKKGLRDLAGAVVIRNDASSSMGDWRGKRCWDWIGYNCQHKIHLTFSSDENKWTGK